MTGIPKDRTQPLLRGIIGASAAVALVAVMSGSASADPGEPTIANVTVETGITMTGITPSFTLTGAPGVTVTTGTPVVFNVSTNNVAGYSVTVQSASPTMAGTGLGGNTDTIPIADLTVRETGTTPYTAMSSLTPVTVHTQAVRSAAAGDNLSNDFLMRIPAVNSDTYTATLNYVATVNT